MKFDALQRPTLQKPTLPKNEITLNVGIVTFPFLMGYFSSMHYKLFFFYMSKKNNCR